MAAGGSHPYFVGALLALFGLLFNLHMLVQASCWRRWCAQRGEGRARGTAPLQTAGARAHAALQGSICCVSSALLPQMPTSSQVSPAYAWLQAAVFKSDGALGVGLVNAVRGAVITVSSTAGVCAWRDRRRLRERPTPPRNVRHRMHSIKGVAPNPFGA